MAQYAVADDGTLAVLGGGVLPEPLAEMAWVTPAGKIEQWPGRANYLAPRFSPDGTRLAVWVGKGVSLIDTGSHLATELVRNMTMPMWKADGTGIIAADRSANQALSEVSLDVVEVSGDRFRLGREQVIATVHLRLGSPVGGFDVWRDGRMVVTLFQRPATPAAPPPAPTLTVIFNAIR